jgi:hypothetical protein
MVCLLKNKENKALVKKYAKIMGSEEAAYYLLASNNGFELDKTPTGEESALFGALLVKNGGDFDAAVMDKSVAYLPEFEQAHGNWTESGKEPNTLELNDGNYSHDFSSISTIL